MLVFSSLLLVSNSNFSQLANFGLPFLKRAADFFLFPAVYSPTASRYTWLNLKWDPPLPTMQTYL